MKKMERSTQNHGYKLIFWIGVFVFGKLKKTSAKKGANQCKQNN